jgi:hypothetical protein
VSRDSFSVSADGEAVATSLGEGKSRKGSCFFLSLRRGVDKGGRAPGTEDVAMLVCHSAGSFGGSRFY